MRVDLNRMKRRRVQHLQMGSDEKIRKQNIKQQRRREDRINHSLPLVLVQQVVVLPLQ